MFNKSFLCKVITDDKGYFESSTVVEGSSLFSVKVNIQATLQAPVNTSFSGNFAVGEAKPLDFSGMTGQAVDLGKWQVSKGSNTVIATGSTNPPRPNTELVVQFEARV